MMYLQVWCQSCIYNAGLHISSAKVFDCVSATKTTNSKCYSQWSVYFCRAGIYTEFTFHLIKLTLLTIQYFKSKLSKHGKLPGRCEYEMSPGVLVRLRYGSDVIV